MRVTPRCACEPAGREELMRKMQGLLAVLVASAAIAACGGAPESEDAAPGEASLRDSFVDQIRTVSFVRDLKHDGNEVTFVGPYGSEPGAEWRVRIDALVIEPQDDEQQPYKGTVKSSWYVNGTPIEPRGDYADLPAEILDAGISQDCWAFWEASSRTWSWV
jgi:hypothetical protein